MSKVYWTPENNEMPEFQILFSEPESLFKHLQKTRDGSMHLKCPAFVDFVKNTYVIKSPIDMEISVNRKTKLLQINGITEKLSTFVANRIEEVGKNSPLALSLPPAYIFYSNDDVEIESIHAFMETNESLNNIMLIPGTFNISKWIRSIDFSIEIKDENKPIKIKKDDVLFYVKFRTKDDSKVELERVVYTEDLKRAVKACVFVKDHIKNLPLKTLYKMAESFLSTLSFRKPKKCPFGFGKK